MANKIDKWKVGDNGQICSDSLFSPHRYPLRWCLFPLNAEAFFFNLLKLFLCWCLPHCSPLNDRGPNQDTAGITTHGSSWSGTDEGAKNYHLPRSSSLGSSQTNEELQERSNTEKAQWFEYLFSFNTNLMKSFKITNFISLTGFLGRHLSSF